MEVALFLWVSMGSEGSDFSGEKLWVKCQRQTSPAFGRNPEVGSLHDLLLVLVQDFRRARTPRRHRMRAKQHVFGARLDRCEATSELRSFRRLGSAASSVREFARMYLVSQGTILSKSVEGCFADWR